MSRKRVMKQCDGEQVVRIFLVVMGKFYERTSRLCGDWWIL